MSAALAPARHSLRVGRDGAARARLVSGAGCGRDDETHETMTRCWWRLSSWHYHGTLCGSRPAAGPACLATWGDGFCVVSTARRVVRMACCVCCVCAAVCRPLAENLPLSASAHLGCMALPMPAAFLCLRGGRTRRIARPSLCICGGRQQDLRGERALVLVSVCAFVSVCACLPAASFRLCHALAHGRHGGGALAFPGRAPGPAAARRPLPSHCPRNQPSWRLLSVS